MNTLLLGNIVSMIGSILMVAIGLIKQKNNILKAQCVQFAVMGTANLILGGVTGFVSGVVGIARNLFCLKWEFTTFWKLLAMAIQSALTLGVNRAGLIGWFPTIAACLYTWFLDTKSEIRLKAVIIVTMVLWVMYDWTIRNYAAMLFDALTILSNAAGILLLYRRKHCAENGKISKKTDVF